MERAKGIEPSYEAWEAAVLPLNYARDVVKCTGVNDSRLEDGAFRHSGLGGGWELVRVTPTSSRCDC
jgi:hypothetical protein